MQLSAYIETLQVALEEHGDMRCVEPVASEGCGKGRVTLFGTVQPHAISHGYFAPARAVEAVWVEPEGLCRYGSGMDDPDCLEHCLVLGRARF